MNAHNNRNVLSVGADAELVWLRDAVLRSAGFNVVSTLDVKEALAKIQAGDCGILLLGHLLSAETLEELAKTFRHSCPNGRIVAVLNENRKQTQFADVYVYGIDGPEALIEAIHGNGTKRE